MDASAKSAQKLFDGSDRFVVPSYQRPYIWQEERQWQPFWDDLERLADARLEGRAEVHFLGAVVLRQESSAPGGLSDWSVIDGQQRLTTLQLVFSAIAHAARLDGVEAEARRLERFTLHDELDASGDRRFRLWPTTANRDAYKAVVKAGGPDSDRIDHAENTIEEAWEFFHGKVRDFALESDEEDGIDLSDPEGNLRRRYGALREAVAGMIQLVAIQLDKGDPAQVIFETLNARGTPLLATDLVKNALLERASTEHPEKGIDRIHEEHWAEYLGDHDYWSQEERLGRILVPRSEAFLMHWLAMKTGEVIPSDELFDRFRRGFLDAPDSIDPIKLLQELGRDSNLWRSFEEMPDDTAIGSFLSFARRVDITTFQPLTLLLEKLDVDQGRKDRAFRVLESYVARRTLAVTLASKDYTKLTGELVRAVSRNPDKPDETLVGALLRSQADRSRWPSDQDVREVLTGRPLYGWVGRTKLVAFFGEIEARLRSGKAEVKSLPSKLQVEHLMPQSWQEHWPVADPGDENQVAFREARINMIGNLTLVSGGLNGSMSNGPWATKRKQLNRHSILLLNKELENSERWDEDLIDKRSEVLVDQLIACWPGPQEFIPEEWTKPDAELHPDLAEMTGEEVRDVAESAKPFVWALLELLAQEPGARRAFAEVADELDWPASRLPSVLDQLRRRDHKYGGRSPFHLAIDGDGKWWIWLDRQAGSIVRQIRQAQADKATRLREETIASIELDSVRELIEVIPERVNEWPGCSAILFPPVGQPAQLHGPGDRGATGYFAKQWIFLWWRGRFKGDEAWFKTHLSKPDQVVVNENGILRLHVVDVDDLDVVLRALSGNDGVTELSTAAVSTA